MPASDGWDVDGIAPRDIFPGVALTYAPGRFFTYPPLHLALLAVLTLPVLLTAVVRAGTTDVATVIRVIIAPSYMTAIAMTARVVTLAMSLVIVFTVAKVAEELAPRERKDAAGVAAAALAAVGAPFTYYSHVTNLDVPYSFWAWLAVLDVVRAVARREPHRLPRAFVLAALAVTTKDQAYAMFLLAVPVSVVWWAARDRANARPVAVAVLHGVLWALGVVLLVDGALVNPRGFAARVAFLSGSASKDYALYSNDAPGRLSAMVDIGRAFGRHYPWVAAPVVALGVAAAFMAGRRRGPTGVVAASVPLLVAASFTACFNLVALRVEDRFMLPQMVALAVYGGLGLERLWSAFGARAIAWTVLGRGAAIAVLGAAAWHAIRIDVNMLDDPRYDAERWLQAHAGPGDLIEVHGLSVYLLRFWPGARVARVASSPLEGRNPMAGVLEVQAPLSAIEARRPRFVVENGCFASHYLGNVGGAEGRIVPASLRRDEVDDDATAFFHGLFAHRLRYHLAHESRPTHAVFEPVNLHASLGCPVYLFERDPASPPLP